MQGSKPVSVKLDTPSGVSFIARESITREKTMKTKKCKRCKTQRDMSLFYIHSYTKRIMNICKHCISKQKKEYSERPEIKQKLKLYFRKYQRKNRKTRRKYDRSYRNQEIIWTCLRSLIKESIKTSKYQKYLGCSVVKFRNHIESLFSDGMSWDNYGYYGWHFDHIKPRCDFDFTKESDIYECFNYKNTRPLWAKDNIRKNRKKQ
jgi:hypothetical protein